MPTTFKQEIISVYENGKSIGFIAKRSVIIGWPDGLPDGWMIIHGISYPACWYGNFETQEEAAKALKE